MANKYSTKISWDDNKKVFLAELLEIPSLSTTGKTKVDALINLDKETDILSNSLKAKGSSLEEIAKKYDIERVNEKLFTIGNSNNTNTLTGFAEIDREIGGLQNTELIVVGGRTGMGKTAFTLSITLNVALNSNKSVAIFTTESDKERITQKLLSNKSEIVTQKIKNADLSEEEWERINSSAYELSEAKIFIDDSVNISFFELQAKCRRLKEAGKLDLIIVDHLQSMKTPVIKEHQTKDQVVGENCRLLKELARELKVPIITTVQLSRAVEARYGEKRPSLTDISESGIIEQVADIVMFLYRPEYYHLTEFEDGMPTQGLAEIILAKHRNGAIRDFRVCFQGKFSKFTDIENIKTPFDDFSFSEEQSKEVFSLQSRMNDGDGDDDVPF